MGRKKPPTDATEDPGANPDLKRLLDTLQRSEIGEIFTTIRRRLPRPGEPWSWWKRKIPLDSVDDLSEFCYGAGGEQFEYRLEFHDLNGKPVKGPDGKFISHRIVPALDYSAASPDAPRPPAAGAAVAPHGDPTIAARRRELQLRKEEMELERQEADLERQRKRINRMRDGDFEDEDDDGIGYYPPHPYSPYYPSPFMQPRQEGSAELIKALVPVLVAFIQKPHEKSGLGDATLIKLLLDREQKGLEPKDILGMMSPLITQMGQLSAEQNRAAMTAMHEVDASIRERLLDAIMSDPNKSEDEIEKWKRYLGFGTEALQKLAHVALGRPTLFPKEKDTVDVPVLKGGKKSVPGLPAPKGQPAGKAPAANPGPKEPTPAEQAKEVVRQRIEAFLLGAEQEALIGSDPDLVAENLEEMYCFLPQTLRFKLGKLDVGDTFAALRDYCPEIVDRILEAVGKDETGEQRKFFEAFWDFIKNPPEEEGEEEEEEEEEEGGEDEPGEDGPEPAPTEDPPPEDAPSKRQPKASASPEGT